MPKAEELEPLRRIGGDVRHRQRADVGKLHRAVAVGPLMLRRDLAGAVLELPRRIGENGPEPLPTRGAD